MADRGRDLKIGILSDVSRFDLDAPARELDDLGKASKDTARKIDDSFDTIARASKQSARTVKDSTDDTTHAFKDVSQEAGDTGREMAASFTGSASDVQGAFQELAANAGASLGPIGLAAGIAAASGVGLITAQQEKLKQMTQDLVQDMIDAGGTLNKEAIDARIQTMATEDVANFQKYNEQAKALGVNIDDITRARAGDIDAIERVRAKLAELSESHRKAGEQGVIAQKGPQVAMADLQHELSVTTGAVEQAQSAVAQASGATATEVEGNTKRSKDAWDGLRNDLGKGIHARVDISGPSRAQLNAIRAGIVSGIGPVLIKPKVLPPDPFRGMH